ncbi:MAG: cytidine/deoxycytidylate deaminase family protein [Nitrospinota bacterium]
MTDTRPAMPEYFMEIAMKVRKRADCLGNKVGAVLVREDRVISTGYNGTPENVKNCTAGGCERCARRNEFGSGKGYDLCICVHAEQNALLSAARLGISVKDAVFYTTLKPCFNCLKEMAQAKISAVYYLHEWKAPDADFQKQYDVLEGRIAGGVKHLPLEDPEKAWAVSKQEIAVKMD